jgi:hypothetical protein
MSPVLDANCGVDRAITDRKGGTKQTANPDDIPTTNLSISDHLHVVYVAHTFQPRVRSKKVLKPSSPLQAYSTKQPRLIPLSSPAFQQAMKSLMTQLDRQL